MFSFRVLLAHLVLALSPSQEQLDRARRVLFEGLSAYDLSDPSRKFSVADLMWIINNHSVLMVRKVALQRLPYHDQTMLGFVATSHPCDDLRAVAIGIHRDEGLKVRICLSDPSLTVRTAAAKGISFPPRLEEIARSSFADVRIAYLEHMGALAPQLHLMASFDTDPRVRKVANGIIKEQLTTQRTASSKKTVEHYAPVIEISTARNKPN